MLQSLQQISLNGEEHGYWMVSHQGRIWLPQGDIPHGSAKQWQLTGMLAQPIGQWQHATVWLICHEMKQQMSTLHPLLSTVDMQLFQLAGRAVQLAEFYRSHRFCGYCGQSMRLSETEWCCLCDHCHERYYPQIAPSIIVAIRHQNRLLLANHTRHRSNGIYTVLAGFVEVGETIEAAVKREVYEETKISIKNLRYITSQPWPFPHSMMLAFMADYQAGEIEIDPAELTDARWFHYAELPKIPGYSTVARRLIEETVVLCRQYDELNAE